MHALAFNDGLLAVIAAGLACHLAFNRFEPARLLVHFALLCVIPSFMSFFVLSGFTSIFRAVVSTYLLYWFTILTSIALYRLSPFHPLAKYPGPILARISKFWMVWMSSDGKQHVYYYNLHKRYGDVVRIGPNELSMRDTAAIQPLMGPGGWSKGPHWDGRMAEQTNTRTLITIKDPVEHARRRRPWNRAFSIAALKGYEEIIAKRAREFVTGLEHKVGERVDLAELINHFTFDFMSDMAFGGGSEMIRDGDKEGIWHLLESGLPMGLILTHIPWFGKYYVKIPGIGKNLKDFRAFCEERAAIRKSRVSQVKDLFHYLIDEDGIERIPPTMAEVISDGVLAIVAGSDTTATTLSNLFCLMMKNPTVYYRLQAEIDKYFPVGENALDTTDHPYMSYLNAVINETLRLFPPVLSGSQRAAARGSGGRAIGPYYLPEGTNAFMHFYSVQRDPRNFSPMPDAFWPERWLTPEERLSYASPDVKGLDKVPFIHNTAGFMAFSFGPANCVGKKLAYQKMRMAICLMMQRLEFRFPDDYVPEKFEDDLLDLFVAKKGSLPVVLSPRVSKD
ncbi:hypothetical protein SERLA73DRAFT_181973 [Serpula lacrymans var. lacrymans S7.3]|uniref:High nitrogen upregulated cytochrome P450 monooxygenase 2 n=2 Tax=Serpula lacrymans var. lacrymans TaxID=341189 RepID=F8PZ31_SERL3|nr:uncharacterized protein SERLADRAFT_468393 [Serpula lacrymans var. lacrymans S7.9]EGN99144.1 hypothetical protein SERLA73DRAFT_181973 [Serpula lacrymans var. lacrymans S7.3]EGO24711.1 hypothetical protein SERLADRAFT_468393 [Serpula lacrymans var. lacrymans S7.9]